MASLTTVGGTQIFFDPKKISAVTDHDPAGAAVTCIYGIAKDMIEITETVAAFFARLNIDAMFAQLTRPNGSPIWISGAAASSVRAPFQGEYAATVKAVVTAGTWNQGVREAPQTVVDALNGHGGNF
jgi:hypothetical protein